VRKCVKVTSLVVELSQLNPTELQLADAATRTRDLCDQIRHQLLRIDTSHFDNEATDAWAGVDRIKSGLNALLKYLDTGGPSKVIEARDKLDQGISWARQGVREINGRRRAYGLRAV